MSNLDKIKNDLKESLKANKPARVSVLRLVLSSLNYKQIETQKELTEEDVLWVLRSEEKKRLEAIEAFEAVGHPERAESEKQELLIIREYLPALLAEEAILAVIDKVINSGQTDFGLVMREAMLKLKGRADGARVAAIVKKRLMELKAEDGRQKAENDD